MRRKMLQTILAFFIGMVNLEFSYGNMPKSRTLEFDYEVVLKDIPSNASDLEIWLPYLPENSYQKIEEVKIDPQEFLTVTYDKTYHNKILNYSIKAPVGTPLKFNVHYKVRRYEYSNKPGEMTSSSNAPEDLSKYLKADRLVTLSPTIRAMARDITRDKTTTFEKARAIYDYVFTNVAYDKTIPGWGAGDTICVIFREVVVCVAELPIMVLGCVGAGGIAYLLHVCRRDRPSRRRA